MAGIRERVANRTRRGLRLGLGALTWRTRPSPDFVVVGAQRAGTTSLFADLRRHPQVISPLTKEVHYFDLHHSRGEAWYLAHFPTRSQRAARRRSAGVAVAGEATPNYLFHPHAPRWARHELPDAVFVVMLRDPVERAYSHWRLMTRLGHESLDFAAAVELEERRTTTDRLALEADHNHVAHRLFRYSYVSRGNYAAQIERWFEQIDRDRFVFLRTEDLQNDPQTAFTALTEALGIEPWSPDTYSYIHRSDPRRTDMEPDVRHHLETVYKPDQDRLVELLGPAFRW